MKRWIFGFAFFSGLVLVFLFRDRDGGVPLSEEKVVEMTPYRYGFLRGERSLLMQMGVEDLPPLPAVARYVSSGSDPEGEEIRGYVDGYHRAAGSMYCPK